jgi:hypothetical protein
VTAYDPYNNVATGYRGTVHFSSSDSRAWLPGTYTFTASDNGAHLFGNGVTMMTPGTQTITVTDINNPSVNGSATVAVSGAIASVGATSSMGLADRTSEGGGIADVKGREKSRRAKIWTERSRARDRAAIRVPRRSVVTTSGRVFSHLDAALETPACRK